LITKKGVRGGGSLTKEMDSPVFKYLFVKISLMVGGGGKAIRATVSMKIALSDSLLALVNNYVKAIRFTLFCLRENVPNPEEKGELSKVHEVLYEKLKEEYNLPSKVAEDCYREALGTYKGWYNNPRRGRFHRVYRSTVWVTPRASYDVDFERMNVRISSVGELPILGYSRNLKE
jgi:hypothetical protein